METRSECAWPRRGFVPLLAAALLLGACHSGNAPPASSEAEAEAPEAPSDGSQPGYVRPPTIASVAAGTGGVTVVSGFAAPDSRIRAVTADQASYGSTTGHDGRFSLELPAATRTRLIAFSMESPNRSTRATGWLFVPPDAPERSVLLKAGAAAGTLAGAGPIATVDYDAGGGTAVSGRVAPNAPVAIAIDSAEGVMTRSDANGAWSARLPEALPPGPHVLHLRTGADAHLDRTVVLAARKAPGLFEATREADGWRVDWSPQGGGAQTTLVLLGPSA